MAEGNQRVSPKDARERMQEAKAALASLTVSVESFEVAGKKITVSEIPALTIGHYKKLKKDGITKANLLTMADDPEKAGIIVATALGVKADDCDSLDNSQVFAVILHLAKKENEKIDWRGENADPT